jgi:hypothetical protein
MVALSGDEAVNDAVLRELREREVTRLCHFTRTQNLLHIMAGAGIVPSATLKEEAPDRFNPTDEQRLDGHTDAICCSIEYPNAWYLDKIKDRDPNFTDWVILAVDPVFAASETTRFCPRNAAAGYGREIRDGADGFRSLFAPSIAGAYGRTRSRAPRHLKASPTDDQAEVLVREPITLDKILRIVVKDTAEAARVSVQFELSGVSLETPIYVSKTCFDKVELARYIREGRRPTEELWLGDARE